MMNGIPIQFLDGIDEHDEQTRLFIGSVMNGYTADVIDDIDTVMNGYDLLDLKGDGSIEDSEKIRNYLLRTKSVVDRYPQSVCGYQNPTTFSRMLGYVLEHWDTANREDALDNMADEETRLAGLGFIDLGMADDEDDTDVCDDFDEDEYEQVGSVKTAEGIKKVVKVKKNKKGFFNQLRKLTHNLNISSDENKIVRANPYFNRQKTAIRRKLAKARKLKRQTVTDADTHKAKVIVQSKTTADGLSGIDSELQNVLEGVDFLENLGDTDTDSIKNYLIRTKHVLQSNPSEYFTTKEEENKILGSLEYAIGNIDDPDTYEAVLGNLSGEGMDDDEYGAYLQGIASLRRRNARRDFFRKLRSKTKAEAKRLIASKAKQVAERPGEYVSDTNEYENVMGMLGYAHANWDNDEAVNMLCGDTLSKKQYEAFENRLGTLYAGKSVSQRERARQLAKSSGTISNLKRAYQQSDDQGKETLSRLIEAEQNSLNGRKFFKKVKNAVKKATKKVAKATKKVVTAPIKATVKATKKVAKATAKVAKKAGKAIKKAVKKIVKFIIKYNPVTLVARAIILMACSLNMFKMAERMYPATLSETEALKYGLSSEQYAKSKECYDKLSKSFTKIGGKESKLTKYLQKGSKKVWKGGDTFSKDTLKSFALKNQKNISAMYDQDEAELKKQGATATNDPKVTYSEQKTEVEVAQETAVNGLLGLIENGYVQFEGLGVVATATIASGSASASGILAGILAKLKNIFASGKVKEAVKKVVTKAKEKIADSKIKDTAKNLVTTTVRNMITPTSDEESEAMRNAETASARNKETIKKIVVIGGGILVLGGVGYGIYKAVTK